MLSEHKKKDIERLKNEIEGIKRQIVTLGELRPGSISEQYNVCGKKGCRFKADPPEKHGPYYQMSYTRKGRSKSIFIKKKVEVVKRQVENYRLLKSLEGRWVDLSIELEDMKMRDQS